MELISPQYRDAFLASRKSTLNCKLPVINLFQQSNTLMWSYTTSLSVIFNKYWDPIGGSKLILP